MIWATCSPQAVISTNIGYGRDPKSITCVHPPLGLIREHLLAVSAFSTHRNAARLRYRYRLGVTGGLHEGQRHCCYMLHAGTAGLVLVLCWSSVARAFQISRCRCRPVSLHNIHGKVPSKWTSSRTQTVPRHVPRCTQLCNTTRHTTETVGNLLRANVRGLKMTGSAVHL